MNSVFRRLRFALSATRTRSLRYLLPTAAFAATIMLTGSAPAATAATQSNDVKNMTYAGWSVHPQFGEAWEAAAHWTVPAVTCSATPLTRPWIRSRAAMWVGTWGTPTNTSAWLPQVGTVSQCNDGGASKNYYAFYQMYHPNGAPQTQLGMTIKPGDKIYAYILYDGLSSGALTFQYWIQNLSRNTQASGIIKTSSGVSQSQAMWEGGAVVETQPDDLVGVVPDGGLAKFSPITFTSAEVDGTSIDKFPQVCTSVNGPCSVYEWDLRSPANYPNKVLATVGSRGSSGKFTVTWKNFR